MFSSSTPHYIIIDLQSIQEKKRAAQLISLEINPILKDISRAKHK